MTIYFTKNEVRSMRQELSSNGLKSLLRHIGGNQDLSIKYIAERIGSTQREVKDFIRHGVPSKFAIKLVEIAEENDLIMRTYQFCPTSEIVNNWLKTCYFKDKDAKNNRMFDGWEVPLIDHKRMRAFQ